MARAPDGQGRVGRGRLRPLTAPGEAPGLVRRRPEALADGTTRPELRLSLPLVRRRPEALADSTTRPELRLSLSPVRRRPSSPWPDDLFTTAPEGAGPRLQSRRGGNIALDPQRWHDVPGPADLALLARARGPVLDIGCGPGRLVHALVLAGRTALGIDVSAAAVAAARRRGAPAVHTSVFGPVPSAGQWGTALLLDGNIGIGGNAPILLRQAARLVAPDGLILVEVDSPSSTSEDVEVRVDHGGRLGRWFPWSRISAGDLPALARSAGLALDDLWQHSGRWFGALGPGLAVNAGAAS